MSKEYDAVLIHGHGYNNPINREGEQRPLRPSIRGHLSISAAHHLGDHGIEVNNYVFSGAPLFGQETPLSQVNATELQRRLNIPDENVFVETTAHTSSQELKNFRRIAESQEWTNLLDMSTIKHGRRVKRLIKKVFRDTKVNIDFLSAEDILETLPSETNSRRYKRIIRRIHWSFDELRLSLYELINYGITIFPRGEELTETISRFFRPRIT